MYELNKEKTTLLINHLNREIENNRKRAEKYETEGNPQLAMIANMKAAEADCTLAYLLGLMYDED